MSDLFLETSLKPPVSMESEKHANPCFECGNCCQKIYGKFTIRDVDYFRRRGFDPHICKTEYEFNSIMQDPSSYPQNLYIFLPGWNLLLAESLELAESLGDSLPAEVANLEVSFIINKDCINYDSSSRSCKDYENRPELCREFKIGSIGCNKIRTANKLEELVLTPSERFSIMV